MKNKNSESKKAQMTKTLPKNFKNFYTLKTLSRLSGTVLLADERERPNMCVLLPRNHSDSQSIFAGVYEYEMSVDAKETLCVDIPVSRRSGGRTKETSPKLRTVRNTRSDLCKRALCMGQQHWQCTQTQHSDYRFLAVAVRNSTAFTWGSSDTPQCHPYPPTSPPDWL